MENRRPDNIAFGVSDITIDETGGSLNNNRSVIGDNSGGSPGEHAHYTIVEIDGQFSNIA
jgi:hypothetical protein